MAASHDTPLYNSRIFDAYLKLLRKRYPHVDIADLLRHAGMEVRQIADQGHWFSQRQVDLFHEKLVQLTGETGIAREAGRYAASPDALGPLRFFMMGLICPEYLFFLIHKVSRTLTRSSRLSSRLIGPRELEITVTLEEGVRENPRQCENRVGFFEAVFLIYGQQLPSIEHTDCVFKGAEVCRYRIRWRPSLTSRLVWARRVSFFLLFLAAVVLASLNSNPLLGPLFVAALVLHLGLCLLAQKSERTSLISSLDSMRTSSERLMSQVQESYDSALMINELGEVISKKVELDDIVSSVNLVLEKRLHYGRGMILLADRERRLLVLKGSFGINGVAQRSLERFEYSLEGGHWRGVLARCFHTQKPLLVSRLADVEEYAVPESLAFFSAMGVNSFVAVPIICEGVSLGVLAVDDPKREEALLQSDLNLIQGVAQVIGVAVRNSMRVIYERELSEQLRREAEQFEERVEQRTAELSQEQEELEFLYDAVSHDLRTPVRVIYGYGDLLLETYGHQLDSTAKEYIGAMIKGGEQIEETLERMLHFSEVRFMELKPEPVDLSSMARRILLDLQVTDQKREVKLQVQEGISLHTDPALMRSILENLLGNAWKYTASKAEACISFGVEDGAFFVRDNGAGFDMSLADRLFKPFKRLHAKSAFAGHGLGLALVNRVMERLGGRIWGVGKPGEGATFYFTFPGGIPTEFLPGTAAGEAPAPAAHPAGAANSASELPVVPSLRLVDSKSTISPSA